jgi:hypothetical protein
MSISQIINSSIISKNNFSPNGKYLLVPKGKNLILYTLHPDIKKLEKIIFNSTINYIEFSPSSEYFLILLLKLQECHIKSVNKKNFLMKIKEPIYNINSVIWSSNDNYILISLNNYNALHIFSTKDEYENIEKELDNQNLDYKYNKNFKFVISNIKFPNLSTQGIDFSCGAREFFAIIIRKQIKDWVEIYDTSDYFLVSSFVCSTINADNILWTKDNSFILVQENKNYDCKLFVYSLSGNLIHIIEPYKNYLGINKLNISPNGHYITATYCDNNIRLYHYLSFKLCKEIFPDNLIIPSNNNKYIFEKTVILVENSKKDEINFEHLFDKKKKLFNIENTFPKKISNNQNNTLSNFSYSFNSQYLAFISIKFPHILLIYDITAFKLSFLIVFENNIIDFIWSPCSLQLVICTENEEKIYFFQPQRAKAFKLPENNNINNNINEKEKNKTEKNLFFSSDGKRVLYKNNKYTFFLIEPGNDI